MFAIQSELYCKIFLLEGVLFIKDRKKKSNKVNIAAKSLFFRSSKRKQPHFTRISYLTSLSQGVKCVRMTL